MSNKKYRLPRLGMRTVKTAICVLICLLINQLFGEEIALNSAIAAIVCMQSTIENTLKIGVNRLAGTAIGGAFGMLLLVITQSTSLEYLYIFLMPLGIIVSIYLCNAIRMPGSSVICAIVYISVLVSPLSSAVEEISPYQLAIYRIIDTAIGIVVAMLVNRYIMPPKMYESRNVHLACDNTFTDVYERVKNRLSGTEQLILYDTSLTCGPGEDTKNRKPDEACGCSIRIPVPTEYTDSKYIYTMHISADYTVIPMYLKQEDGYVEIPSNTFPCTTVWQASRQQDGPISLPFK